jgi:hypothetical protein
MLGGIPSEDAEILALKALRHLAESPAELGRFLGQSGLEPAEMSARAEEHAFQAAVLDFILADDALLGRFCAVEGSEPRVVHLARLSLSPGAKAD